MFIYKVTNIKNNKIYIGLTIHKNINTRFSKHVSEMKAGSTYYFHKAIRKYGPANFKIEELDKANSIQELKQKEIDYIKFYNSNSRNIGYNLTSGGDGTHGVLKSEYTRNLIRQKALGRKWTEERKQRHSEILKSKNIDKTKAIENCKLYNLKQSKKIIKLNLKGEIIQIFDNIGKAAIDIGITRSTLSLQLKKYGIKEKQGFTYKIKEN